MLICSHSYCKVICFLQWHSAIIKSFDLTYMWLSKSLSLACKICLGFPCLFYAERGIHHDHELSCPALMTEETLPNLESLTSSVSFLSLYRECILSVTVKGLSKHDLRQTKWLRLLAATVCLHNSQISLISGCLKSLFQEKPCILLFLKNVSNIVCYI